MSRIRSVCACRYGRVFCIKFEYNCCVFAIKKRNKKSCCRREQPILYEAQRWGASLQFNSVRRGTSLCWEWLHFRPKRHCQLTLKSSARTQSVLKCSTKLVTECHVSFFTGFSFVCRYLQLCDVWCFDKLIFVPPEEGDLCFFLILVLWQVRQRVLFVNNGWN